MSIFFTELRKPQAPISVNKPKAAPKPGSMPTDSLRKLGCTVCPRDAFEQKLTAPKMPADGSAGAAMYFLNSGPTAEDDRNGYPWSALPSRVVVNKLVDKRGLRFGGIVQCAQPGADPRFEPRPGAHEVECCRGRVVADIEACKPVVVIGVGDDALDWATGLGRKTLALHGQLIATKIGSLVCWYFPLFYPNYVHDNRRGTNEFEMALKHDVRWIEEQIENGLQPPTVYEAPFDGGIELITGNEPGDMQRLEERLHAMLALPAIGFDIETNGLDPYTVPDPKMWTAAVGTFEHTVAFPLDHPDGWGTDTRIRRVHSTFAEFLQQSGRKRCHNAAMEMEWTSWFYGRHLLRNTEWEDTLAMAHTLDERKGTKSLDTQVRIHFGFDLKRLSNIDVKSPDWIKRYSIEEVLRYNALDTKWTDKLAEHQLPVIHDDTRTSELYERYMRLAPTLVLTTAVGMPVDREYAADLRNQYNEQITDIERKILRTPELRKWQQQRLGIFRPTSPDDVLKLMRDVLKRTEVESEPDRDGNTSFTSGEPALGKMPEHEVPSAKLILEHRRITRNVSTYLSPAIDGGLTGPDGRLHATYSALHTSTGRLNSRIHNWPKHHSLEVRGTISPEPWELMIGADYGQIEFRVCGMLSRDPKLVKYCWTGYDVHAFWAKRMIDAYPKIKRWVEKEDKINDFDEEGGLKRLRQYCKNRWVFPMLFGSAARSCAKQLDIPESVADDLAAEFWDEFPVVREWQAKVLHTYERKLYVETMGGFRRHGLLTPNEAINAPIQGTAGEIVLAAMTAMSEMSGLLDDPQLHPAYNGHDDLTYIVNEAEADAKEAIIVREMCRPRFDYINVPLIIEVSRGKRWHELKEVAKYSSVDLYSLTNPYI